MKTALIGLVACLSLAQFCDVSAYAGEIGSQFSNHHSARAGFYVRIPFNGGIRKQPTTEFRYGFSLGMSSSFPSTSLFKQRQNFHTDMLKLDFSSSGIDKLSFGHLNIVTFGDGQYKLFQDENGSADKSKLALIGGGLAVIALGIVVLGGKDGPCRIKGASLVNGVCVGGNTPNPIVE